MRTRKNIQQWLVERVGKEAGILPEEIELHESLAAYGFTSLQAIAMTGELEIFLGRRVSPTLTWDYPTLSALVEALSQGLEP